MKREFLTISNLLSIFRALLSVPFALVMLLPDPPLRFWAVGILLAGMMTDKLDGDLARRRGEETEWGKILDPLADKVCVAVMALVLLKVGDFPLWFVLALLSRDMLIFLGGMYLKSTRGVVLPSNVAGKWGRHLHRVHHTHYPAEHDPGDAVDHAGGLCGRAACLVRHVHRAVPARRPRSPGLTPRGTPRQHTETQGDTRQDARRDRRQSRAPCQHPEDHR